MEFMEFNIFNILRFFPLVLKKYWFDLMVVEGGGGGGGGEGRWRKNVLIFN